MTTQSSPGTVRLYAMGDVGPSRWYRENPASIFDHVKGGLAQADLRFCQVERTYSTRGAWHPASGGSHSRLEPDLAKFIPEAGFDVVSLASNHSMDWGHDALLDTKALFQQLGVKTAGTGKNIQEAREPAIIERNGVRIAFLAYCSVVQPNYWADENRPGCAPMRIHRYYEPYEYQAGTPVKIVTIPYEEDLAALLEDIRRAREKADVVLVSIHWGVHFIAKVIADYQPVVGHAALDAGADAILGHHAHILKAVEVYKGKPIYYSMCNFALDSPGGAAIGKLYGLPITDDPAYPFPPDARKTLVATLTLSKKGVERAGFLPAFVEKGGKPVLLERSDPRFDDVVSYMEWLSDEFPHTFSIEGNEVILKP